MPFDYENYQQKCNGMTAEQLQKEWENYTRQMSAGATSTATSILLMPLTGGISAVGLGLSAPRIHNARKKREIIEAGLKARGTTHHTRMGDVLAPMAVSGAIGGLTLGLAPPGASDLAAVAVGRAVEIAATNTALNAAEAVVVSNTQNKIANEQKPEQHARIGTMPIPFLMEEAVLAFEHPSHSQNCPTPYGLQASTTLVQTSNSSPYDIKNNSMSPQSQHDSSITSAFASLSVQDPGTDTTRPLGNPGIQTTSDVALFTSIPSHKLDDYSDFLKVDEEDMLKMHALALAMEKQEADSSMVPASSQIETLPTTNGVGDRDQSYHLTGPFQPELFENVAEITAQPEETVSKIATNQPDAQEERPALPSRHPRAVTLPAKLDSAEDGQSIDRDIQSSQFPHPSLPPYQPEYFSPPYQAAEPQQYYPPPEPQQYYPSPEPQHHYTPEGPNSYPTPPPPQQRQDSGYGSMYSNHSSSSTPQQRQDSGYVSVYSNHSSSSTPQQRQDSGYVSVYSNYSAYSTPQQTYYPTPNMSSPQISSSPAPTFVSRHSSIPQSYQQIAVSRKPVPNHPAEPNLTQQQMMNQGHRNSDSSLYPMTPPPPYYAPPGMQSAPVPTGKEQGYFNQTPAPQQYIPPTNASHPAINPLLQQPQKLVDGMNKGWQWARAAAMPTKMQADSKSFMEPNYGPPPAVPTAWRGS